MKPFSSRNSASSALPGARDWTSRNGIIREAIICIWFTALSMEHEGQVSLGCGDGSSPGLFLDLDESNAALEPVDPDEFASPECQSRRGYQQKKFFGFKDLKRSNDIKSAARG